MSAHRVLFDLFAAPYRMVDPGASGTITVLRQMAIVPVVTAAAEARTLARPTKDGLLCTVILKTNGGDLTLTVTGGYNQGGDTSITYADAGDWITFQSVLVGSTYTWRVVASEGTTLAGTVSTTSIILAKIDPSAAYNGAYVTVSQSATYAGSIVGVRSTVTCSATAGIGNMYAGRFELIQSALPSSQGHTTALYVQTTCTGATNNPTSVMSLVLAGASGGNTTPFINFIDTSTDKTLYLFEAGTGGALAESSDATACFDTGINVGQVSEITHGLRVKVNGADYYLLMGVAATVAA